MRFRMPQGFGEPRGGFYRGLLHSPISMTAAERSPSRLEVEPGLSLMRRLAARSRHSLAALISRGRSTMAGRPLVDELIQ